MYVFPTHAYCKRFRILQGGRLGEDRATHRDIALCTLAISRQAHAIRVISVIGITVNHTAVFHILVVHRTEVRRTEEVPTHILFVGELVSGVAWRTPRTVEVILMQHDFLRLSVFRIAFAIEAEFHVLFRTALCFEEQACHRG